MQRRPAGSIGWLVAGLVTCALLAGCDAPLDDPTFEVRAPVVGEVEVARRRLPVGPLAPARFDGLGAGPHTVTFLGPAGATSIVDAPGPIVDLAPFVDAAAPVDGVLYPLRVRPAAGGSVVAVADGRVFEPVDEGGDLLFRLPDVPTTLVVVWRDTTPRLTRRPVASPRRAGPDVISVDPITLLPGELLVAVEAAPAARVRAELTEQGLRTGLVVAEGFADVDGAFVVPRPVSPAAQSGLWITATALANRAADEGERVVESAVRFDAAGLAVGWPALPALEPPPRPAERALALDPAVGWGGAGVESGWTVLDIEGRGRCVDSRHRVVVPAGAPLTVPTLPGPDPLAAPLVHARVSSVRLRDSDLAEQLAAGVAPAELPQWTAQRVTAAVDGFWEVGAEICDPPPLRGAYTVAAPDDTCALGAPPPRAVITRCGHLVAIDGDRATPLGCGRFTGEASLSYRPVAGGAFTVARDGEALVVPSPAGAVRLTPVAQPSAIEPSAAGGAYTRFSLERQPVDREGRALDDYAVIDGGRVAEGAAATISRGVLTVRTPQWAFDGRLVESDSEGATAAAETGGCAARPAQVTVRWGRDVVIVEGTAGERRHRLTLRR